MSHSTFAYIDERMCCKPGCFSAGNAWPTALPAAFVWREVASPTAFEKENKRIILKTTRDKVNFYM